MVPIRLSVRIACILPSFPVAYCCGAAERVEISRRRILSLNYLSISHSAKSCAAPSIPHDQTGLKWFASIRGFFEFVRTPSSVYLQPNCFLRMRPCNRPSDQSPELSRHTIMQRWLQWICQLLAGKFLRNNCDSIVLLWKSFEGCEICLWRKSTGFPIGARTTADQIYLYLYLVCENDWPIDKYIKSSRICCLSHWQAGSKGSYTSIIIF